MIMNPDTDLCIVKGMRWSETARNYASGRPFLALKPLDCVNFSLKDPGVLNKVVIVRKRIIVTAPEFFARRSPVPRRAIVGLG